MADSNSRINRTDEYREEHSLLAVPLRGLIQFVLKFRAVLLVLMVLTAVFSGIYAQQALKFKNKRIDLINPKSEWNQYWLDYVAKFGSDDDLIIVVDGETPEKIIQAVNETAAEIEKKPELFYSLFYQFDDSVLLSKALYFASDEELEDLNLFLMSHQDVFHGNWDTLTIDRILPQTVMPLSGDQNQIPPRMASNLRMALDRMVLSLENALGEKYQFVSPFPEIDISKGREQNRLPAGKGSQPQSSLEQNSMHDFRSRLNTISSGDLQSIFPKNVNQRISVVQDETSGAEREIGDIQSVAPFSAQNDLFQRQDEQLKTVERNFSGNFISAAYSGDKNYSGLAETDIYSEPEVYSTVPSVSMCPENSFSGTIRSFERSSLGNYVANYPNFEEGSGINVVSVPASPFQRALIHEETSVSVKNSLKPFSENALEPAPINPYYGSQVEMPKEEIAENSQTAKKSSYQGNSGDRISGNAFSGNELSENSFSENAVDRNGSFEHSAVMNQVSAVNRGDSGVSPEEMTLGTFLSDSEQTAVNIPSSNEPILPSGHDSHIHYTWLTPNKTAVMMVKMIEEENEDFARGTVGIDTLRGILKKVQESNPGTSLKLTGLPVMENDEMRSSQNAMGLATWLSILGIAFLYVFFFRQLRHPILAMIALFIGIGWSMGFIMLFVGHLNILSISFAVILVGLGIDFSIHYTLRYLQCRSQGDDTYSALVRSIHEIGPGILTGALTTAAAFFTAGATEFTGIAELGIIAGGGVLCCCFSALTFLPILIMFMDKNRAANKIPKPRDPIFFHVPPKVTFIFCVVCLGGAVYGVPKLYYDYNLLNLQPEGLESVELEHRLIEESKQSVWYAISMSDNEQVLRERIEEFEKLSSVERVEQLVTLIPGENPLVRQIHDVLLRTPSDVAQSLYLTKEDARKLYQCLETARQCLKGKEEFTSYLERIQNLQEQLCEMKLTVYFERMTQYQRSLAEDLLAKLNALEKISSPEPPTINDLPKPYVERMVSEDGTYLLKIYGKGDLWDMENLETFVKEVRSVDPKATGNPLQTYECSLQMKKGYQDAAIYALIIVFLLVFLDLRSIVDTMCTLFPIFMGLLCTFGIMGFFDIPLNAANLIVLPLILGIGIDDGVHIIHDYRKFYRGGIYRISSSTSVSIILTSLTTILSFGTLMLAQHRGLQSLGLVLVIGTTCCWLSSLLLLPAILNLFFTNRPISATENANPCSPEYSEAESWSSDEKNVSFSSARCSSVNVPHSGLPVAEETPERKLKERMEIRAVDSGVGLVSTSPRIYGMAHLTTCECAHPVPGGATCYAWNRDDLNSGKAA